MAARADQHREHIMVHTVLPPTYPITCPSPNILNLGAPFTVKSSLQSFKSGTTIPDLTELIFGGAQRRRTGMTRKPKRVYGAGDEKTQVDVIMNL